MADLSQSTTPAIGRSTALRVCHILSGDLWAGAEVQAAGLIKGLSRRDDIQVSVILLNEGRLANELRSAGIEVGVIAEGSNSFRRILKAAGEFVDTQKPEVLHSHRYKENLLAALLARKCHVPATVRTQHGWPEPVKGLKALRHAAVLWLDRFCGRRMSSAVIGVSAEMMPRLQRIYGSRAVLVRNAIDTDLVTSSLSRADAKRRLSIPDDVPIVGIVGRLEQVKRIDLFLSMAQLLLQQVPSAQFIVTGTGSREGQLRAQATELGVGERVKFLGHRDDVYDVLRSLDVLVMCSDSEGLPMVLLEALWLGVPVVGRAVGGIKEVLGDNECGTAVSSANPAELAAAVEQCLRDPETRDRQLKSATKCIRQDYSLTSNVEGTAHEYWRLMSGEPTS